jgi:hypothetical protein
MPASTWNGSGVIAFAGHTKCAIRSERSATAHVEKKGTRPAAVMLAHASNSTRRRCGNCEGGGEDGEGEAADGGEEADRQSARTSIGGVEDRILT